MNGVPEQERRGGASPIAREESGLDACVHCGFCLQACPTYLALEDENDSPRGRLVLMRALADDALSPHDDTVQTHIGRCLGCRACETACPSGVPYGALLEATRATLEQANGLTVTTRVLLWTFAHPVALRVAMACARLLAATPIPSVLSKVSGSLGFAMAMLVATEPPLERAPYEPRGDGSRGSVALLRGCVMEGLFAGTNRATERTLAENDYVMVNAPGQRCCGALHAHAGDVEHARDLARANIAAFERSGCGWVVTNSAGCGAAMKEYAHLLRDDDAWRDRARTFAARVRDVSELLAEVGPKSGAPLGFRVTYDAPCHLQHAQRVVSPPLAVLAAVPGLLLEPLDESDQCCGGAGIYNLLHPETSALVLDRKLERIAATGASLVATGNPGCLMQIGAGCVRAELRARTIHPVDLLDASYAAL